VSIGGQLYAQVKKKVRGNTEVLQRLKSGMNWKDSAET
jgi:hypothetical protein